MWHKDEEQNEYEELAVSAGKTLDSMDHPFFAQKKLIIYGAANLIIFGLGALFHNFVNNLYLETKIFLILCLFPIGFFFSFAVIKLIKPFNQKKVETSKGNDFMGAIHIFPRKTASGNFG